MASRILNASWYSHPCLVSSQWNMADLCIQKEIEEMRDLCFLRLVIKDMVASALLLLGRGHGHLLRTLKQPYGEACMVRNWGLPPRANTNLQGMWENHLGNVPFNLSQTSRWLQPLQTCTLLRVRDPEPGTPERPLPDFRYTETEIAIWFLFLSC